MSVIVIMIIDILLKPHVSDPRARFPSPHPFAVATHASWTFVVAPCPQPPRSSSFFTLSTHQHRQHHNQPQRPPDQTNQTKTKKPKRLHNFSVSLLLNINLRFSLTHLLLPEEKSIRAVRPSNQGTICQEKIPGEFYHRLKPKTALY